MLWVVVVVVVMVVVVIIWTMIEMMKPVSNVREQKARGCKSADIWKVQRQSIRLLLLRTTVLVSVQQGRGGAVQGPMRAGYFASS